ncbi:H-NS family nucleoid-associated regulatory protein [Dickeya zeae]
MGKLPLATGQGHTPRVIAEAIEAGKKLEDFQI